MVVRNVTTGSVEVIDYQHVAPAASTPDMFGRREEMLWVSQLFTAISCISTAVLVCCSCLQLTHPVLFFLYQCMLVPWMISRSKCQLILVDFATCFVIMWLNG